MIDGKNWGGVVVSPNPVKKTATFKVDLDGNLIPVSEFGGETKKEKQDRLKQERAKRLGFQK